MLSRVITLLSGWATARPLGPLLTWPACGQQACGPSLSGRVLWVVSGRGAVGAPVGYAVRGSDLLWACLEWGVWGSHRCLDSTARPSRASSRGQGRGGGRLAEPAQTSRGFSFGLRGLEQPRIPCPAPTTEVCREAGAGPAASPLPASTLPAKYRGAEGRQGSSGGRGKVLAGALVRSSSPGRSPL